MQEIVVVLGGTSRIAVGIAEAEIERGARVYLVGRDEDELRIGAADLQVRTGAPIGFMCLPALTVDGSGEWSSWLRDLGRVDRVYSLIGSDTPLTGDLADDLEAAIIANLLSPLRALEQILPLVPVGGAAVVVSSVAHLVPRADVLAYGSAKAALSFALQSMMRSERYSDIRIIEVRLGWVDTRMSTGRTVPALTISPHAAGERMVKAAAGSAGTRYVPGWWRLLALAAPVMRAASGRRFVRRPPSAQQVSGAEKR